MGLKVEEIALTTSYGEKFTIQPGTTEVLLELPESKATATLGVFIKSIGGTDTGLSEGGTLDEGGAWTLKFGTDPVEVPIVVHARASEALNAILTTWTE